MKTEKIIELDGAESPETKIEKEESGAFLFPAAQKIKNGKGAEDKKMN